MKNTHGAPSVPSVIRHSRQARGGSGGRPGTSTNSKSGIFHVAMYDNHSAPRPSAPSGNSAATAMGQMAYHV